MRSARRYNPADAKRHLQRTRQAAGNAHNALELAQARIRELETTIETLNRRLINANHRAQTAESHAMPVIATAATSR